MRDLDLFKSLYHLLLFLQANGVLLWNRDKLNEIIGGDTYDCRRSPFILGGLGGGGDIMPNKQQTRKLKNIRKIEVLKCEGIPKSDMEIYKYLESLGYVHITRETEFQRTRDGIALVPTDPLEIRITEPGKDYLASEKQRKIEMWIPIAINTIISVIALIFSLLSLSTTAPDIWKNIEKLLGFL